MVKLTAKGNKGEEMTEKGTGIFEGTFLDGVAMLLGEGEADFSILDKDPVQPGEEVIGEMEELEKALFVLAIKKREEIETLEECPSDTPEDEPCPRCAREASLKNQGDALVSIAWQIITDRLQAHNVNLGLRENGQIVKRGEEPRARVSGLVIIGGGGGGGTSFRL